MDATLSKGTCTKAKDEKITMLTGPILVNVEGWDGFSERLYKNKGWRDLTIGELD
jgi:hypothetical protein